MSVRLYFAGKICQYLLIVIFLVLIYPKLSYSGTRKECHVWIV